MPILVSVQLWLTPEQTFVRQEICESELWKRWEPTSYFSLATKNVRQFLIGSRNSTHTTTTIKLSHFQGRTPAGDFVVNPPPLELDILQKLYYLRKEY